MDTNKIDTKALAAQLKQQEKTEGRSGAVPLTPKRMLLDASDVAAKRPDKRLRWVNLKNPDKVASRVANGYTRISASDGGRSLGEEMALFEIPKAEYERRVAQDKEMRVARVNAYKKEWEKIVDGVARELRDKYGHSVNVNKLTRD